MVQKAIALIRDLNAAWQTGDFDTVANAYAEDAVLLPPDLGTPIQGRDPIVHTYREFTAAAELLRFDERDLRAYGYPTTSIVHLSFEIEYRLGDEHQADRVHRVDEGLEIYVVGHTDPLEILWRQQCITSSRDLV